MKIYVLWTTDIWLMRNSFELHGNFSSLKKAIVFAKKHQLKDDENHIVIDIGRLDDYDSTCERVFTTEKRKDRQQLE